MTNERILEMANRLKSKNSKDKQRHQVKMKQIEKLYRYEPNVRNVDSILNEMSKSKHSMPQNSQKELKDIFNSIVI